MADSHGCWLMPAVLWRQARNSARTIDGCVVTMAVASLHGLGFSQHGGWVLVRVGRSEVNREEPGGWTQKARSGTATISVLPDSIDLARTGPAQSQGEGKEMQWRE